VFEEERERADEMSFNDLREVSIKILLKLIRFKNKK
jgi:hypothetical protein